MDMFTAIAEPTRRSILEMLVAQGELPSSAIAKRFKATPSAISQHLKVLREAKLVRVHKKAQQRLYTVNPDAMLALENWARLMNSRLDSLDKYLKEDK